MFNALLHSDVQILLFFRTQLERPIVLDVQSTFLTRWFVPRRRSLLGAFHRPAPGEKVDAKI